MLCASYYIYLMLVSCNFVVNQPISHILVFNFQSAALKEAIDDLEWPGSSIQIILQPVPPSVTFKGEGHGDLQVPSLNLHSCKRFLPNNNKN